MSSRTGIGIVAALGAGLLGGWGIARMSLETRGGELEPGPAISIEEPPSSNHEASSLEAAAPAPARTEPAPVTRVEATPAEDEPGSGLFGHALERHARAGIARGWRMEREDDIPAPRLAEGLQQFEATLIDAPEEIGRELGRIQNELEEASTYGDLFVLLEELHRGTDAGPAVELVSDGEAYAELFEPRSQPSRLEGLHHLQRPDEAIVDGTTLQFPAGVFRIEQLMRGKDPFPRDVTIQGAGMDATLLLFGDLSTRNRLVNFAVRDCTVFLNGYLFDLRSEPATLQLERVRLIGFDRGAGGSYLFSTRGIAVDARDCRFEGGYGRSPQHCRFFRYSGGDQLFRFQNCTFARMTLDLPSARDATIVFDHCSFEDLLDRPPWDDAGLPSGVRLIGTQRSFLDWQAGGPPTLDLDDLFPGWEERLER